MADVCVVGLGKLGLPLAALMAASGHTVTGVDVSPDLVESVNAGNCPIDETGLPALMSKAGSNLVATTSLSAAVGCTSAAFIVVPTPSNVSGEFSNEYVIEAVRGIGEALQDRRGDRYLIVVCSTIMPGSLTGEIRDALTEAAQRELGLDIALVYSPEFIALGSVIRDMMQPDMIMIGSDTYWATREARRILVSITRNIPLVHEMSPVDAEIAKISVNSYVTMKISYANQLAEICKNIPGADVTSVLRAVGSDSRIGKQYLRPGGPFGGPCFCRDSKAFVAVAKASGTTAELAEATDVINDRQVAIVAKAVDEFGPTTVGILGLSYKPSTAVTENSLGVRLVEPLSALGCDVLVYDPEASGSELKAEVMDDAQDLVDRSDVVVVATCWDEFKSLSYDGRKVVDPWHHVSR